MSFQGSCTSLDLLRLSRIIRERIDALRPFVVTSRALPALSAGRMASITRSDLVRGLLGTALRVSDPFEEFPDYTNVLLEASFADLQMSTRACSLEDGLALPLAA
jgi:hypothetical protein